MEDRDDLHQAKAELALAQQENVNREQAFPATLAEKNARNATLAIEAINQEEMKKHGHEQPSTHDQGVGFIDAVSRVVRD